MAKKTDSPDPREHHKVFISLGSNLQNPRTQLAHACDSLKKLPDSRFKQISPVYRSKAVGPGEQADYLNAVAEINSTLKPLELLKELQNIENTQGRIRRVRWGARTLDLDILLFAGTTIDLPSLQVPHPRMQERNFVIYPLFDIAPKLVLPNGVAIESLLTKVGTHGLQRLEGESL